MNIFGILTKYLLYFLRMMVDLEQSFLEAGSSRQEFLSSLGIIISSCNLL
jgi:hypothetical protein